MIVVGGNAIADGQKRFAMRLTVPIFKLKRQAKALARKNNIPLYAALNHIAVDHGFKEWSNLSSHEANQISAVKIFKNLNPSDLLLLAARPGHGKTLLALQIILKAINSGKQGFFFTLDYTKLDIWRQIKDLGFDPKKYDKRLSVDTSDDICAEHISNRLTKEANQAFIIIDYLQLLDQKRENPPLKTQVQQLVHLANQTGSVIVVLSQIHRSYELSTKLIPELKDIKLPNPVDLTQFNKTCFLHDGIIELSDVA